MSVVNKMLKDLEQRQSQQNSHANYVPSNTPNSRTSLIIIVLIVLLLALGGALVWLLLQDDKAATSAPSALTNQSSSSVTDAQQNATSRVIEPVTFVIQDASAELNPSEGDAPLAAQSIQSTPLELAQGAGPSQTEKQVQTQAPAQQQTAVKAPAASTSPIETDSATKSASAAAVSPSSSLQISASNKGAGSLAAMQQEVNQAVQQQEPERAIAILVNMSALAPRESKYKKQLASLYFAQGKVQQASSVLEQGIALNPQDSSLRLMQARLLFREKDNQAALQVLLEHPENALADDELLSFRAALAEKQNQHSIAMQDYQSLLQRQPNNARWWLGLAISQDKQGFAEPARLAYQRVQGLGQLSEQVDSFVVERLRALENQ